MGRNVCRVGVKGDAVGSRAREEEAGEEKEEFSRDAPAAFRAREDENWRSVAS